jgi:hypothetical protein
MTARIQELLPRQLLIQRINTNTNLRVAPFRTAQAVASAFVHLNTEHTNMQSISHSWNNQRWTQQMYAVMQPLVKIRMLLRVFGNYINPRTVSLPLQWQQKPELTPVITN